MQTSCLQLCQTTICRPSFCDFLDTERERLFLLGPLHVDGIKRGTNNESPHLRYSVRGRMSHFSSRSHEMKLRSMIMLEIDFSLVRFASLDRSLRCTTDTEKLNDFTLTRTVGAYYITYNQDACNFRRGFCTVASVRRQIVGTYESLRLLQLTFAKETNFAHSFEWLCIFLHIKHMGILHHYSSALLIDSWHVETDQRLDTRGRGRGAALGILCAGVFACLINAYFGVGNQNIISQST